MKGQTQRHGAFCDSARTLPSHPCPSCSSAAYRTIRYNPSYPIPSLVPPLCLFSHPLRTSPPDHCPDSSPSIEMLASCAPALVRAAAGFTASGYASSCGPNPAGVSRAVAAWRHRCRAHTLAHDPSLIIPSDQQISGLTLTPGFLTEV